MPLSEEDRRDIALRHGKDIHNPHVLAVANAAYALGAERARVAKPLVWNVFAEGDASIWRADRYSISWSERHKRYVAFHPAEEIAVAATDTIDAAIEACDEHHAAYVLSLLEPV